LIVDSRDSGGTSAPSITIVLGRMLMTRRSWAFSVRPVAEAGRRASFAELLSAAHEPLIVLRAIDVVKPVQDVGSLPQCQTEIAPVERDVGEAHCRTASLLLRREPVGVRLQAR